MSTPSLYAMRAEVAAAIVSAGIGVDAQDIIIERQVNIWQTVPTVVSRSRNKLALALGVQEGRNRDRTGKALDFDLTLTASIFTRPVLRPGEVPEEGVAEDLMRTLHGLRAGSAGHGYEVLVDGFGELETDSPDFLVRQIVLKKRQVVDMS